MSTTRIKDKVSQLVNSQLPEFIRTDYTTFVAFLEYYYQFLEQDQGALELVQNARQYSDIDQTTDAFVNYFLTNYAKDLPVSLLVDKSLLIKRIKGLYAAKGSSLSIETLFKVLYDTSATTRHPYDSVLRPSDGRWNLRTSIRVLKTYGSTADIKDRFLNLVKNNIAYRVEIVRVKILTTNLYEIFYKSAVNVPFEIEDTVDVKSSSGTIFTGTIKPTTTAWEIRSGGTGFRSGQIFNVSVGGVDTLVRIAKVSSTGAIQTLKFLNYGYNFTADISISLSNNLGVSAVAKYFNTTGGGFTEDFNAYRQHSILDADRYFDSDYVTPFSYTGVLLVTSSTSSQQLTSVTTIGEVNANDAVINFYIGAIARYPGEHTSTQGFLSEPDVKLQDGKLYQPFAYQVESELDISVFYDLVKKLVHQAGTNLFVNRALTTTANIAANVNIETRRNVFFELNTVFNILDTAQVSLKKNLTGETANITDALTLSVGKLLTDSVTPTETINIVQYLSAYNDNTSPTDSFTYSLTKPIIDDTNVTVTESLTIALTGKIINDTASLTESGSGLLINYTDNTGATGYFSEIFTGESVITIS